MRTLFLRLILSGLLAIMAGGASAENGSMPAAAPPAAIAVTPEQARRTLEVLEDEGKRARTIELLRVIGGLSGPPATQSAGAPAQPPAKTAAEGADKEATHLTRPDSLGAQMLVQASEWIGDISDNIESAARTVIHFPVLWRWIEQTANDPYARDRMLDAAWKLIAVFGCALALEWLAMRALQRPMAALERNAERMHQQANERADTGGSADRLHLGRMWRLLQRLPLIGAHALLDLLPVLVFAAAGNLLLGTPLGTPTLTRLVILAVINAYVMCRVVMCITRMLVLPGNATLRVLALREETAAYIEIWVRRVAVVAIFGIATAEVARLLGLHRAGYAALVRIVMLIVHVFAVIIILQCRRAVADWIRVPQPDGAVALIRNRLAEGWHVVAIFFVLALWVVWAMRVQNGYALVLQFFLATLAVLAVARLAAIVVLGGLDRIFRVSPEFAARFPGIEARANRYYPVMRGTVSVVIGIIALLVLLEIWGIDALHWFDNGHIGGRLLSSLATIAVASAIALLVWESVNAAIERHLTRLGREARYSRVTRLRTLLPMVRTSLMIAILTVVGLTALSELGVNIAPLLAGAGIVGVAIGFGSQKLVQDLITGLFLLLENAMQVGDFVTVSGLSGKVENLSIRTIRLRANDGSVHIIPFSAVTSVTNTNRGIGNASISVNVAYKEDTDRVGDVLKEIAAELRQDPEFRSLIRGDLALWGVDKIDAGVVTILGQIECTDAGRWSVQREFNRRMKKRFQEVGIEIAAPTPLMIMQPLAPERPAALPAAAGAR
jgi:moderate conductance mechanosensitive channel